MGCHLNLWASRAECPSYAAASTALAFVIRTILDDPAPECAMAVSGTGTAEDPVGIVKKLLPGQSLRPMPGVLG
jgi:hypothetical protein